MNQPTPEDVASALLAVLPLVNRIMAVELRQEAGEDTTMPQFRVLGYLHEAPLTVSALARKRQVSLQSAAELVQTLVARGWIVREPDPNDRRQSLLYLTDEGRLHYHHAQERMSERLVMLLADLNDNERATVQGAMNALSRVLAQKVEEQNDTAG